MKRSVLTFIAGVMLPGLLPLPACARQDTPAMAVPELAGTAWLWQRTLMNNDEQFVPANPGHYVVRFAPDGAVAVRADCNQLVGRYAVADNRVSIDLGPATLAACPEGSLGDLFTRHLGEVRGYLSMDGDLVLELKFDSGVMRFSPQPGELAGTEWSVIAYNNGREAVVSVLAGTKLTAAFGDDGVVRGVAGCNTYQAGYEASGESISMGQVISTMMACAEPDGILEQERRYLTALSTVATYQVNGDRLEMRTTAGAIAMTFRAADN